MGWPIADTSYPAPVTAEMQYKQGLAAHGDRNVTSQKKRKIKVLIDAAKPRTPKSTARPYCELGVIRSCSLL